MLPILLVKLLDVCPLSKCPRKISQNKIMSTSKLEFSEIMSHSASENESEISNKESVCQCNRRFEVKLRSSFITTYLMVTHI